MWYGRCRWKLIFPIENWIRVWNAPEHKMSDSNASSMYAKRKMSRYIILYYLTSYRCTLLGMHHSAAIPKLLIDLSLDQFFFGLEIVCSNEHFILPFHSNRKSCVFFSFVLGWEYRPVCAMHSPVHHRRVQYTLNDDDHLNNSQTRKKTPHKLNIHQQRENN